MLGVWIADTAVVADADQPGSSALYRIKGHLHHDVLCTAPTYPSAPASVGRDDGLRPDIRGGGRYGAHDCRPGVGQVLSSGSERPRQGDRTGRRRIHRQLLTM